MLKKTIKFTDFDGLAREEDHYFNLTKAELTEWEASVEGGLIQMIQKLSQKQDTTKLFPMFKELILKSYGEKSPDGRRFIKSAALSREFEETLAYDELMMELIGSADATTAFIEGILPQDLVAEMHKQEKKTAKKALPAAE